MNSKFNHEKIEHFNRGVHGFKGEFHYHRHFEITLLLSGDIRVYNGAFNIDINQPCLLLQQPYVYHCVEARQGVVYDRYNIYIRPDEMYELPIRDPHRFFLSNVLVIPLNSQKKKSLESLIIRMQKCVNNRELFLLLSGAFILEATEYINENCVDSQDKNYSYIGKILRYIEEHICENLTLPIVAKEHNVCITKLCSDFKQVTTMSVAKYIQKSRIERAKILLLSNKSVAETTFECGFENECHFITVFKKTTGVTPGRFMRIR